MSSWSHTIARILPGPLRKAFLQRKYRSHGNELHSLRTYGQGRFYLYEVNGIFLPAERLEWHLDYPFYEAEAKQVSLRAYTPREGDTVIDLGAGIGEEALVFAKLVGKSGRVICVEANPVAYEVLQDVIRLNALTNVTAINKAIYGAESPVTLFQNEAYLSGSVVESSARQSSYRVEGTPLHQLLKTLDIKKIDFLKANIEGAERFLINDPAFGSGRVRRVAIAAHDFRYHNEKAQNSFYKTKALLLEFLGTADYQITTGRDDTSYLDNWIYGVLPAGGGPV